MPSLRSSGRRLCASGRKLCTCVPGPPPPCQTPCCSFGPVTPSPLNCPCTTDCQWRVEIAWTIQGAYSFTFPTSPGFNTSGPLNFNGQSVLHTSVGPSGGQCFNVARVQTAPLPYPNGFDGTSSITAGLTLSTAPTATHLHRVGPLPSVQTIGGSVSAQVRPTGTYVAGLQVAIYYNFNAAALGLYGLPVGSYFPHSLNQLAPGTLTKIAPCGQAAHPVGGITVAGAVYDITSTDTSPFRPNYRGVLNISTFTVRTVQPTGLSCCLGESAGCAGCDDGGL